MRVVALEYHDIVGTSDDESGFPGGSAATYKVATPLFRSHLDALTATGALVANDARTAPGRAAPSAPPVLLTFDDGGVSAHSVVAELLEARGWRGHFFVTTQCIGQAGFLDRRQIRDLHERGHVMGSHSASHPVRMSSCPPERLRAEWSESIRALEDILGSRVDVASVPGGYVSRDVIRSAAEEGIRALFTSEPESRVRRFGDTQVHGRYTLRHGDAAAYVARLVGRAGGARASQWLHWNAKKLVKRAGGEAYLRLRARILDRERPER
jgi:peptidoglycan/xylan/chitin deacetylase (PgdA/CDA1 family)